MKPTHKLKYLNKRLNIKAEVGAGWYNTNGSISIVINPLVVLAQNEDSVYTLFPIDTK